MPGQEFTTSNPVEWAAPIPRDLGPLLLRFDAKQTPTTSFPMADIPDFAYRSTDQYKTPIGPKDATDKDRGTIENRMLDIARRAAYTSNLPSNDEYSSLAAQTRTAYRTGGIKPHKDEAGLSVEAMAERFVLSGMTERMAALVSGADKSLFDDQMMTILRQSAALKLGALESESLYSKIQGHWRRSVMARAVLTRTKKLSEEDLKMYDETLDITGLAVRNIPKSSETSSGIQKILAEILEHSGLPKGWMKLITRLGPQIKQPPQSAEVVAAETAQNA